MTLRDPVLLLVLLLQAGVFVRCWFLARGDDSDALDGLWKQFRRDVIGRASRGDGPDWVRYMDEADRVHERRIDKLRVWATAALVVGIGGTMAALAIRLTGAGIDQQSSGAALGGLIAAVGPALWASLSGVVNNAAITLALFPLSDQRFGAYLDEFRNAIQTCSAEHPPHEKFANAVRDQLGNAFREAVQTFPAAFAQLDESVEALGEVTEAQSKAVLKAAAGLKESADGLTGAASGIAPVAELLRTSTDRLRALPDQLAQTLNEAQARWTQEMRRDQDSFIGGVQQVLDSQQALLEGTRSAFNDWEQQRRAGAAQQEAEWLAAIDLVQKAASDIVKTVEGLPATFTREVERTSDTMGKQFGLEARQHVADLTGAIRAGNSALGKQVNEATRDLQNRFLNDTPKVVAETLDRVYRDIEGTLLSSLREVGEGLREALRTLPENAESFAGSLSTADEKLQRSIGRLTESAAHLQRVAKLTEQFEASLSRALQDATARSFEPLRVQMQDIVVNGHQKPRQSEQMVDHNILGVWSGASSDKGKSGRRARSRRQGREPRESGGGAQRRALTPASTRGTCRSDDAPATTTSCGRHESRIRRFLAVANNIVSELRRSTGISEAPSGFLRRLVWRLTRRGTRYDDVS